MSSPFSSFPLSPFKPYLHSNWAVFLSWPSTKSQRDFPTPQYFSTSSWSAFLMAFRTPP